ncbi:MAG: transglutaminase-like domain-containing protein [bacterium]
MMRSNPKVRQLKLEIGLYGTYQNTPQQPTPLQPGQQTPANSQNTPFRLRGTTRIAVPVLLRTSWCDTDFSTLDARVTVDGFQTKLDPATVFTRNASGPEALLVYGINPQNQNGQNEIRVSANWQVQRWELAVDENIAARATWPRKPEPKLGRFLSSEPGIDPTNPTILRVADGATPGGARSAGPFIAARNAVAAIAAGFKSVSGGTSDFGPDGSLRGIGFSQDGASWGLDAGRGSPVEICATCVAGLRAIGIPSRLVYCIDEGDETPQGNTKSKFRFIGEFFLADIGWIPFDPMQMRLKGIATRRSNGPIKGFANVDDLQDCTPFAFRTVPDGYDRADRYALWGWNARGASINEYTAMSRIALTDSSRGNGKVSSMPAPVGDDGP